MKILCCLLLLAGSLAGYAQTSLQQLLDELDLELDATSLRALEDWIASADDVSFEWTSDWTAADRRRTGRRYDELIAVRSPTTKLHVYGGRKKRRDELLLVARLDSSYVRLSLTGDFNFR